MSVIFPARLLPKTHLASVSRSLYAESPSKPIKTKPSLLSFISRRVRPKANSSDTQLAVFPKSFQFSVAAWLRLGKPIQGRLSLLMVYSDDRGEFAALIEEIDATDQDNLMMSGDVIFPVHGVVHQIDIYLGGSAEIDVQVEQLYVKKSDNQSSANSVYASSSL